MEKCLDKSIYNLHPKFKLFIGYIAIDMKILYYIVIADEKCLPLPHIILEHIKQTHTYCLS